MKPRVSVVIPTYGRPEFLDHSVRSALSAGLEDVEVLVVDDGSPVPVVASELPDDPRIRILRLDTNGGPGRARNIGIEGATAPICAFLDDDDLFASGRLSIGLESVRPGVVSMCRLGRVASSDRPRTLAARIFDGDMSMTLMDSGLPALGQGMFHRCDFQPFDVRLRSAEDADWWIKMSLHVRFTDVPNVGYLVRDHPERRHGRDESVTLANRLRLLQLHRDYFAQRPRARANHYERIAAAALMAGDARLARRAVAKSLRYPTAMRWRLLARGLLSRPTTSSMTPPLQ